LNPENILYNQKLKLNQKENKNEMASVKQISFQLGKKQVISGGI
jgi:hypothetical protein